MDPSQNQQEKAENTMVQINFAQKSVSVKVVYYGPGMSGKTTNLEVVHQRAPDSSRGDLTSISTDGDRTLFFDFMPLDLGTVAGMHTQFQIYTVPGQVYYNSTRKLVLQGVDGVIFIADSGANMMEENLESLANLEENLAEYGKGIAEMPLVIQYNKRDLPNALSVAELDAKLNKYGAPTFEAVASSGQGVFPTLKALAARVLESIHDPQSGGAKAPAQSAPVAPGAPAAPAPLAPAFGQAPAAPVAQQPAPPMPAAPIAPAAAPMGGAPAAYSAQPPMGAPAQAQAPMGQQPPMGAPAHAQAPFPNSAPPAMGQPAPQPMGSGPLPGHHAPAAQAPAPSSGGLSMAPSIPAPEQQQVGQPIPPQAGAQSMYQPSHSHAAGQPVAQQAPTFPPPTAAPGAGVPTAPPGQMMGAPGQSAAHSAAPRPVQQSTRLKPRTQQHIKAAPISRGLGKGKWLFLSIAVLGAAGVGVAYFLGYITN